MNLNSIKNFFTVKKQDKEKIGFDPNGFWSKTIITFLIFIVVFLSLSLYLFYQILHERVFVVEVDQTVETQTIEQEKLDDVIMKIDEKRQRFEQLQNQELEIIDPGA